MSDWATVAGTLGGAGLGIGSGWWMERQRWRRSEDTRWLSDLRHLYARLVAAGEGLSTATFVLHDGVGDVWDAEGWEVVAIATKALGTSAAEVELIGGQPEVDAAQELVKAGHVLVAAARFRTKDDEAAAQYAKAFGRFSDARVAFVAAARACLVRVETPGRKSGQAATAHSLLKRRKWSRLNDPGETG